MTSWLHRAIVSVPESLSRDGGDRVVFFDTPKHDTPAGNFLQQLLAQLWDVDPAELDQCIYNVEGEYDLAGRAYGGNDLMRGDLCLLETGAGGHPPHAVGPKHIHYAEADKVDLYVTTRHAQRIRQALQRVELMRRREERGQDPKAPAWIVSQARDEILAAEVPSKLEGQGPIYKVNMRRPGEAYADPILVDGAQLAAPTLAALKRLEGVETIRRARPQKPPTPTPWHEIPRDGGDSEMVRMYCGRCGHTQDYAANDTKPAACPSCGWTDRAAPG